MKLTRTANAGIYLATEGCSLLVDGVCEELPPYLGTPDTLRQHLCNPYPDVVVFTHRHSDHFEKDYALSYEQKTLRSTIGPESFPKEGGYLQLGNIRLTAVPTRHIGKAGDVPHMSYVIEGEKCLWVMGDAAPLQWRDKHGLPKPQVLVVPFAYAITNAAWQLTKSFGAEKIVLLHMPAEDNDPYGLWQQVRQTVGEDASLLIPKVGETLNL